MANDRIFEDYSPESEEINDEDHYTRKLRRVPLGSHVYISSPLTTGKDNIIVNTRTALMTFKMLLNEGYVPVMTHTLILMDLVEPIRYESWLDYSYKLISRCDAVLRLPGDSKGANEEVNYALANNIIVCYSVLELLGFQDGPNPILKVPPEPK